MYLNCHSYYSFKYGTISPEQLLREAYRNKISCISLTDINNTSGVLDFFRLSQKTFGEEKFKVKPVAGIDFRNGAEQKFIGLARNINGFHELNIQWKDCQKKLTSLPRSVGARRQKRNCYPAHSLP